MTTPELIRVQDVLEVGSGVGLCALAACIGGARVLATDGDEGTLVLLQRNIDLNRDSLTEADSVPPRVSFLRWDDHLDEFQRRCTEYGFPVLFPVIIAADILYACYDCPPHALIVVADIKWRVWCLCLPQFGVF
jgi:predicted nicotinamide N-methyase